MGSNYAPQISGVSQVNARVDGVNSHLQLITGNANGRPPDASLPVVSHPRLERQATHVCVEDQQSVKRCRGDGLETMDVGLPTMVSEGIGDDCMLCERNNDHGSGENHQRSVQAAQGVKTSFRNMLAVKGESASPYRSIPDLDVELTGDDVQISSVDGTPSIKFSDRIHDLEDAKLANAVIVLLLGRVIGYSALLTRIKSLWSSGGDIALIDLENGYYLVRFANAADVTKVLMGGPWLIYGNYLTVQPWSRSFSTDEDHPDKIVVWDRLLGPPFRYYTKSMFCCIVGAIGKIIKIDYNTSEGKRGRFARLAVVVELSKPLIPSVLIDGVSQKIEYEGLPIICYSCGCYGHTAEVCKLQGEKEPERPCVDDESPGGKFGPWMQAPTRKLRRVTGARNFSNSNFRSRHQLEGMSGKFDILNTIDAEDEDTGTVEPVVRQGVSVHTISFEEGAVVGDQITGNKGNQEEGRRVVVEDGIGSSNSSRVLLRGSGSKPSGGVSRVKNLDGPKVVVSNEIIVPSKVTLNSNNHVVVRVVERGSDILPKKVTSRKATNEVNVPSIKSGQPLSIGKNVVRKGATVKQKQQHRAPSQVTLGDWIGNLSREITSGTVQDGNPESDSRDECASSDFDVQWKENTAFDPGLPQ
ncbi:hypothetical protein GQ457_10G004120 [Hibiscus cannabinus]